MSTPTYFMIEEVDCGDKWDHKKSPCYKPPKPDHCKPQKPDHCKPPKQKPCKEVKIIDDDDDDKYVFLEKMPCVPMAPGPDVVITPSDIGALAPTNLRFEYLLPLPCRDSCYEYDQCYAEYLSLWTGVVDVLVCLKNVAVVDGELGPDDTFTIEIFDPSVQTTCTEGPDESVLESIVISADEDGLLPNPVTISWSGLMDLRGQVGIRAYTSSGVLVPEILGTATIKAVVRAYQPPTRFKFPKQKQKPCPRPISSGPAYLKPCPPPNPCVPCKGGPRIQ